VELARSVPEIVTLRELSEVSRLPEMPVTWAVGATYSNKQSSLVLHCISSVVLAKTNNKAEASADWFVRSPILQVISVSSVV